ncbi:helix-turn-helix domain-containing protein [Paracoccus denitrificans]|uniref:helix-turn-helix domain-containing protein n=1 Tax=Paracoccus denitrificans TaxID=266 RepID=UPI003365158D
MPRCIDLDAQRREKRILGTHCETHSHRSMGKDCAAARQPSNVGFSRRLHIARELGKTPASVSLVSQGLRRSQRIQRAIAEKLDTTPENIWPDRYEQEGTMKS